MKVRPKSAGPLPPRNRRVLPGGHVTPDWLAPVSEQGGDYDLATYSNMTINPSIPNSAVELNPPGAKIEHPLK